MLTGEVKRRCVFCGGPADSREHVFAKRLCERARAEKLTVIAGTYTEGQGIKHRPEHLLDALTVRRVCTKCNNGWMNDLEEWFDERLGYLIEPDWPRLAREFIEIVKSENHVLAQWLMKTAVMFNLAAVKGNLRVEFPTIVVSDISAGKIPEYSWVDLGFSQMTTVGGQIGKCFRTVNGGHYQPSQIFSGFGFCFVVQFNHLLLRIARATGTDVNYDPALGGRPIRLYPIPDRQISTVPTYVDFMKFQHSVVLRTWKGCPGNVPQTPS
jgi:hypothetical protein